MLVIDGANTNRYRIVCNEEDGSQTAYYFGVPIYDIESRNLVELKFREVKGVGYYHGTNADVLLSDYVKLKNGYGDCVFCLGEGYQYVDETCVKYDNVKVFPTLNGIACVTNLNSFSLSLKLSNCFFSERGNGKQFSIMREKFKPFLTVSSIGAFSKKRGVVSPATVEYQKTAKDEYVVTINCNYEHAEGLMFEINLQEEKLIQDTTVESENPQSNNVFGGAAFIGRTDLLGEQWLYSRLDFSRMEEMRDKKINKATVFYPTWDAGDTVICAYALETRFCSFGSNWENKKTPTILKAVAQRVLRYQKIDVTDMVTQRNQWFELNQGWVLKRGGGESSFSSVATGDSFFNPLILEIKYNSAEGGRSSRLKCVEENDMIALDSRQQIIDSVYKARPKLYENERVDCIVEYNPNEKAFFFSCLEKMECYPETQLDYLNAVVVSATGGQIKMLKKLPCVERVERDYEYLPCDFEVKPIMRIWEEISNGRGGDYTNVSKILGNFSGRNEMEDRTETILSFESMNIVLKHAVKTSTIILHIYEAIDSQEPFLHLALCSQYKSFFLEKLLAWGERAGLVITSSRSRDLTFPYPAEFNTVINIV